MTEDQLAQTRRQQILAAATAVFAEKGFDRTRMDEVAAAAGVSKGTLYLYFDSKEAIFHALLSQLMEAQFVELERLLDEDLSVVERLQLLSDQMSLAFEAHEEIRTLMFEFFSLVERDPAVKELMQGMYQRGVDLVRGLLEQGVQRGELRPDLDVERQALRLLVLNEGYELIWMVAPRFDLANEKRAALADLLAGWVASGG